MNIPNNVYNFMIWVNENCQYLQANAVEYKDKIYFTDRKTEKKPDGGLNDLWKIYIKKIIG